MYIYGPAGRQLEQINSSTALWFHQDQLGSVRLVTDVGGVGQASYGFDAYGNLIASSGAIANPFLFAGEYRDAESSLYYLRSRYYDTTTGQFASADPLVAVTLERYAYVEGNPLNGVDPSGRLDLGAGWNALTGGIKDIVLHPGTLEDYARAESQLPGIVQLGDGKLFQFLYQVQQQMKSPCAADRIDAMQSIVLMTTFHGRTGTFTTDEKFIFGRLEKYHRIDPRTSGLRLHAIKTAAGRGGEANVDFDRTGNVYDPDSGERLGSLTQGGGG